MFKERSGSKFSQLKSFWQATPRPYMETLHGDLGTTDQLDKLFV